MTQWIKWAMSFMHWKHWTLMVIPILVSPLFYYSPGAAVTTGIGVIIGLGYILLGMVFLVAWWCFATSSIKTLEQDAKIIKKDIDKLKHSINAWWNQRPNNK